MVLRKMRYKLEYAFKSVTDGRWKHGGFFPTLDDAKEAIEHFKKNLSKDLNFKIEMQEEVHYE